ncbi:hypothetical protein PV05_07872 [Exophiala xenobiotica]|uniref:Xylanolytic transcriptional activator regulatory domain-containing protein n=1 Tax=Exophiala xenobiotica TaxID=348802 RepID=A0A0D2BIN2_9EURO|nr:uncharacterized protein PV05_07872 [Exophiala xenobiotica]KIW52211.1 hypothetical protein PV05_07872 [Exophiala xenobiotica]
MQIQLVGERPLVPRPSATVGTCRQFSQPPERQVKPKSDLSHGTAIELVDHYLDKFCGRPHSIFHQATLRSQVRNGSLNEALLYAVCAIGCKFSGNPYIRGQGSSWAAESKRLLQADISNICLENIQACILVAMLSVGHGDSASEALFFRIATALAEIMSLNSPFPEGSVIDREIRRRVWWSLYMTDMWCISGQGLHSQLKGVKAKIELPINDRTFMSLHSEQLAIVDPLDHGIWAQMITLVPLFGPIHNINRLAANGETHTINLDQQVEQLAGNLEDWKQKLPIDAQMNHENLRRQQKRGLGGLLISIHLAYHHYATLLYFRYLEVQLPRSASDRTYITRFSSSVLVHTLLFGDLDQLETASRELNTNFEALMELSQYWPAISAMIERLLVFQDMCLLSTESGTHKLDGWMLRFLIEHSLDIEAKKMQVNPSSLNADSEKLSSKAKELTEQGRYLRFRSP